MCARSFLGMLCRFSCSAAAFVQPRPASLRHPRAPDRLLKSDPLHVFSQSVQELSSAVTKSVVQVLTIGYGLSSDNDKRQDGYHDRLPDAAARSRRRRDPDLRRLHRHQRARGGRRAADSRPLAGHEAGCRTGGCAWADRSQARRRRPVVRRGGPQDRMPKTCRLSSSPTPAA